MRICYNRAHSSHSPSRYLNRGQIKASLHGDPADYYPFFSGYREETGTGAGFECNLNVPLARNTSDDAYLQSLEQVLALVSRFKPDALVAALGLDASEHDPLQFLRITTDGFRRIGAALGALRRPTVLVREGGYISESLGANLVAALEGFEGAR